MKVKQAIEQLQEMYNEDDTIAINIWGINDIVTRCNKRGIEIPTVEEQKDIIELMDYEDDCSTGMSWETVDLHLCELSERKKEQEG